MSLFRVGALLAIGAVVALTVLPASGQKPPAAVTPANEPWFVDDEELLDQFVANVSAIVKQKPGLSTEKLRKLVSEDGNAAIAPIKPSAEKLEPEDVYRRALPSVFLIGTVLPPEKPGDDYVEGRLATAWALTADGVLVTNWHVFDELEDGEVFGVMDHRGRAYPVTDILGVNKSADIAIIRVAAKGLTPLPVAAKSAPVGAWVGVLGHPGDRYFTFTQGAVSRYNRFKLEDGVTERWMSITADYAYGSSGSPVLDRTGAVVGMATLTENIDYPVLPAKPDEAPRPKDPAPKPKPEAPAKPVPPVAAESLLQMVVKLTVPVTELRKVIGAD